MKKKLTEKELLKGLLILEERLIRDMRHDFDPTYLLWNYIWITLKRPIRNTGECAYANYKVKGDRPKWNVKKV